MFRSFAIALVLALPLTTAAATPSSASKPKPAASTAFFAEKVVVLSGAEGGVGQALVTALLQQGATVYAGVRATTPSEGLAQLQTQYANTLHIGTLDVTDSNSIAAFRQSITAPQVHVLINAAGVNIDEKYKVMDLPSDRLQKTFDVNVSGAVRLTQAIYPLMHLCTQPVVANITSVMGSISQNAISGSPAYRMSKAALNMFTKVMAIEEPAMVILSLHPGWVKTKMGTQSANITAQTSAAGLLRIIAKAGPKQSGHFFRYSGDPVPW